MLVALAIGRAVLELFSISIGDFTTAGGIIIFLIGLNMVLGLRRPRSPPARLARKNCAASGLCR
jgi:small neutral amino acid transporter SnatA (MarC family)